MQTRLAPFVVALVEFHRPQQGLHRRNVGQFPIELDRDGVTLYAYNGGGGVSTGPMFRASNAVCVGSAITLTADCGTPAYQWSVSDTNIAMLSALSGSTTVVTGKQSGTVTITQNSHMLLRRVA